MRFILIFILLMNVAFACPVGPHEFMLSQMRGFGEPGPNESGISEEEFRENFTRVTDHYLPQFKAQGLEVNVILDWSNSWMNAQTGWTGAKSIKFFFSGALARIKYMTPDALLFVACHEVGHHLGGFPKKDGGWATAEGGADYFAALKCMRTILKGDEKNSRAQSLEIHPEVRARCHEVYADEDEYFICLRTAQAGDDMGRAFKHFATKAPVGSLFFSELPNVTTTLSGYPSHACRVETAYQGAICSRGPEYPISYKDEASGYCHENNGDTFGMRPRCWFVPTLKSAGE